MTRQTVLVLGAHGLLGRFTARAFHAAGYQVLRAGRRPESTEYYRRVDLDRAESLATLLEGVDLVVSSVEDPQMRVERVVLRRGGLLLQANVPASDRRAVAAALAAECSTETIGTVGTNIGLSGISSLVLRDLLEQHPEADAAELAYVICLAGSTGPGGAQFAHRVLTAHPAPRTVRRLFPAPFGERHCFDLGVLDECLLSPAILGQRRLNTYLAIAERPVNGWLRLLNRLGLLRRLPAFMFSGAARLRPAPIELTREPISARLAVYKRGRLLAARGLQAEGDYNASVQSTLHIARVLLARGPGALPRGIHAIEDLLRLTELRDGLKADRVLISDLPIE